MIMIKLARPTIPNAAVKKAAAVLRSGNMVQGRYARDFELAIERYLPTANAVVVANGTAALHLSLVALGIGPGDEVIIPALTFPATANVVELVGARPVLVDIGLDDCCIDPAGIERAISLRTAAVMPVHEFGQPADMYPILAIARRHGLTVIEDAACALGAEYHGRRAGTMGATGCFSLHPRKMITTGEGGIVVTKSRRIANKVRALRNHGIVATRRGAEFNYAGFNYRMTDFQAALGLTQLKAMEQMIRQRRQQAAVYGRLLEKLSGVSVPKEIEGRRMVYQTYHVLLDKSIDRDAVIGFLRQKGIETNFGAQAISCLKYYRKKYGYREGQFPKAAFAYRQGLALPMGTHVTPGRQRLVATLLRESIDAHRSR